MVTQNNFFDLWDIFVNELIGDIWITLIIGIVVITLIVFKTKLDYEHLFLFIFLWVVIVSVIAGQQTLWVISSLAAAVLFFYNVARAIRDTS